MRVSLSYHVAAPFGATQTVVTVMLSFYTRTACCTAVAVTNGTRELEVYECAGCSDGFMMQRSAEPYQLQNPGCVDTATQNSQGNGCNIYTYDSEDPYSSKCFDPYYDDNDFTASTDCCACQEVACPAHVQLPNPGSCEDWIEWDASVVGGRSSYSNLGGLGPDTTKPREIMYYGAMQLSNEDYVDVVLTNLSTYAGNPAKNTVSGKMANLHLKMGYAVNFKAEFVHGNTFCPATPILPKITFCDIDGDSGRQEIITVYGAIAVYTTDYGNLDYNLDLYQAGSSLTTTLTSSTTIIQTQVAGRTARKYSSSSGVPFDLRITAMQDSLSGDNPSDPNDLINYTKNGVTTDQSKRCVMVEFHNTSEFIFSGEITGSTMNALQGRNVIMSGTSKFFTSDESTPCMEGGTRAPTPSPTPEVLVSGIGDPHLTNMHGEHFDIYLPGVVTLLQLPQKARPDNALLTVEADAKPVGDVCSVFFQAVNISGSWTNQSTPIQFLANPQGTPRDMNWKQWMRFGTVDLKVVYRNKGFGYLNVHAKLLGHFGYGVGGLLGSDDNAVAKARPRQCMHHHHAVLVRSVPQTAPATWGEDDVSDAASYE